jgi:hypothetical protein
MRNKNIDQGIIVKSQLKKSSSKTRPNRPSKKKKKGKQKLHSDPGRNYERGKKKINKIIKKSKKQLFWPVFKKRKVKSQNHFDPCQVSMRNQNIDQGIIVKSQPKSHHQKQGQIDPQKKETKASF